jgi:hypothetical protein
MSAKERNIHYCKKAKIQHDTDRAVTNNSPKDMPGSRRMKIRTGFLCSISAFLISAGPAILSGCARPAKTQALFTRPELITHNRLAVIGLTPEQEQIFMASYIKAFPGQMITFVERNRLQEVINEQDLLQGRLNDKMRARIKELFGVEALIMCTYYDGDEGIGRKKLRIRIVDSATGAIVGSVITEAIDNFGYHCDTAIKALKADLQNGS